MPYRKVGNTIIEYISVPAREQIIRIMNVTEFNALFDTVDNSIKAFDAKKYSDDALKSMQDKLNELDAVKTTLGG